jgi:hypothetical protein
MSAPRRYDVAGFLFAGGNRLLSVSIDASQAGGVTGQRLPIRSTGPTRFIGVPSRTAPSRHWRDRSTTPGLTMQLAGGDQPVGNTPWRSLYRRWRSGTRPSTRVVPSAIDRFICVWKHELIPRTPISTRSRSTNTRRRELVAIRGRVSWRGYVRVGSFASVWPDHGDFRSPRERTFPGWAGMSQRCQKRSSHTSP